MAELFATGRMVDIILALMVAQGIAIIGLRNLGWALITPRDYLFTALPGACLLLALRSALVDGHWTVTAGCLLAGLVTHLLELWQRSKAGRALKDSHGERS
ncbi:MAG: hypothetical protein PsegKO_10480 [Pseudohongiellaceae bacterium]|jgi:hypothetical protein